MSRIEAEGTDLTLDVRKRTWVNSDGRRNMPSGEVFTGPLVLTQDYTMESGQADLDSGIADAIAAPRAAQRNTASVTAEPAFIDAYGKQLKDYGHTLTPSGDAFTSAAEIGAATAIEFLPDGVSVWP